MTTNLTLDSTLSSTTQTVKDQSGNASQLMLSSTNVAIGGSSADGLYGLAVLTAPTAGSHLVIGEQRAVPGQASAKLLFVGAGIQHAGFAWSPSSSGPGSLKLTFGTDSNAAANPASFTFLAGGALTMEGKLTAPSLTTTSLTATNLTATSLTATNLTVAGPALITGAAGGSHLAIGEPQAVPGQASARLLFVGAGIQHAGFAWSPSSSGPGSLKLTFGTDSNAAGNPASFTFLAGGDLTMEGKLTTKRLTLTDLPPAPAGLATVSVVVDPTTGIMYRK